MTRVPLGGAQGVKHRGWNTGSARIGDWSHVPGKGEEESGEPLGYWLGRDTRVMYPGGAKGVLGPGPLGGGEEQWLWI